MKIRLSQKAFSAWLDAQPHSRVFTVGEFRSKSCPLACYIRESIPRCEAGWVGWRTFGHDYYDATGQQRLPEWAISFVHNVDALVGDVPLHWARASLDRVPAQ